MADSNDASNQSDTNSTKGEGHSSKVSVLIADDVSVNATILKMMLAEMGISEVECVINGQEALDYVKENLHLKLVLMDVRMPKLNGTDAARLMREAGFKNTILAVTADTSEETQQELREAGIDGLIAKPILPDMLKAKMTEFGLI